MKFHVPHVPHVHFKFPTFWRFHVHSSKCECCPTTEQRGVVVKRRRVSVIERPSTTGQDKALTAPESNPEDEPEPAAEPQQSPIDIHEDESDVVPLGSCPNAVTISMGSGDADLEYDGHSFHVVWSEAGKNAITIDGKVFHAVQFHFHTPSEHTLDGVHTELELHLVHQAEDGSFAVLGVLIQEGKTNAFLDQFWDKLADIEVGVHANFPVGSINPEELGISSSSFFRYCGSLTTPPYTEGVEWIVIHDVMEASREQLDAFHRALPGTNARDLQPLNHRHVQFTC